MNLVDKIKAIRPGTKVTLMVANMFGNIVPMKATIIGEIEQDGFISKTCGSWSLLGGGPDWEPCYKVRVKPYRKKGVRSLKIGFDVHDVEIGWKW